MPTIVSTIGSNNRDFPTPQAWQDSVPLDLVGIGTRFIGEMYNDSEFKERLDIVARNTSPEFNMILRPAAGQGVAGRPNASAMPLTYDQTKGVGIRYVTGSNSDTLITISASHTVFEGIQVDNQVWGPGALLVNPAAVGVVIKKSFFRARPSTQYVFLAQTGDAQIEHTLFVYDSNIVPRKAILCGPASKFYHCGLVRPINNTRSGSGFDVANSSAHPLFVNCFAFGFTWSMLATGGFAAGSTNNAGDNGNVAGTNPLTNLVYADQFVQPSTALAGLDFRLKTTSAMVDKGVSTLAFTGSNTDLFGYKYGRGWDIGPVENVEQAQSTQFVTAPALGYNGVASTDFTVGMDGLFANSVIISPNDGGFGGTFTPASVTVSAASPTATFKYTPTNVGEVTISLTNNSNFANATSKYVSATASTKLMWESVPESGRAGRDITDIIITSDGVLDKNITVTPTDSSGGTFSPTSAVISQTVQFATFTYTGKTGGVKNLTMTNSGTLTNPPAVQINLLNPIVAVPTLSDDSNIVKTVGTGKDFPNLVDFGNYARTLNLVELKKNLIAEVYENQAPPQYSSFYCGTANDEYQIYVQPVPGFSAADYDPINALDYNAEGIELDLSAFAIRIGKNVVVQDFRLAINSNGINLATREGVGTKGGTLRRNRIRARNSKEAITSGEYGVHGRLYDNLIIRDAGTGPAMTAATCYASRNTFVARDTGSFGTAVLNISASAGNHASTLIDDNAFVNAGLVPVNNLNVVPEGRIVNNVTNQQPTVAHAGIKAVTDSSIVVNALSDFRPVIGGALQAKGSDNAIGTMDVRNTNRGGIPDIGCIQSSVRIPLPLVTITSIEVLGQDVVVRGTTQFNPTSGYASLLAADQPMGATSILNTPVVLTAGEFSVRWPYVEAGSYKTPVIRLTNAGGYNRVQTGGGSIDILDVLGNLVEGDEITPTGGAPVIAFSRISFDNTTMSVTGTIDNQGDKNVTMTVIAEPLPSGVVINPVRTVNIIDGTWGVQFTNLTGSFRIVATATANGQTTRLESTSRKIVDINAVVPLPLPAP